MSAGAAEWQRFGRFNFVGVLGAGLQLFLTFALTQWMGLPGVGATPLAVEVVLLHNFAWHERFTWSDRRFSTLKNRALALWRFHAGNGAVSIGGNTSLVYCLVNRLHVSILVATAISIAACSMLNFFVAERWVYRHDRVRS